MFVNHLKCILQHMNFVSSNGDENRKFQPIENNDLSQNESLQFIFQNTF